VTILKEASSIKLTGLKVLKSTRMQILLEDGVLQTQKMQTVFNLELVLLFVMRTVP
jgi:hypothetical protein